MGKYEADLVVNRTVIVELKTAKALIPAHEAQLLNYLKATEYEVGMLLNYGIKAEFKRMIYENSRKGNLSWVLSEADECPHTLTITDYFPIF